MVAALIVVGGFALILQPREAPAPAGRLVGIYLTDLPGGCEEFILALGAASVSDYRLPLKILIDQFPLSRHHGADESVKVAEGIVPPGVAGRVDLVITSAACRIGADLIPVDVPNPVLSIRDAVPEDDTGRLGSAAAVLDIDLGQSLYVVQREGSSTSGIEFVPAVKEVIQVITEPGKPLPDLGMLLDGLTTRVDRIEAELGQLSQKLTDRLCMSEVECGLRFLIDYAGLPPEGTGSLPDLPTALREWYNAHEKSGRGKGTGAPAEAVPSAETTAADDPDCSGSCEAGAPVTSAACAEAECGQLETRSICCASSSGSSTSTTSSAHVLAGPNAPSSPAPADHAIGLARLLTLRWTGLHPEGRALTYSVKIGDSLYLGCQDIAATSCPVHVLPDTEYTWSVTAKDDRGATKAGPVWEFQTKAAPTITSIQARSSSNTEGTLQWTFEDADGNAQAARTVKQWTGNTFQEICADNEASNQCVFRAVAGVTYTLSVDLEDHEGFTTSSVRVSFTHQAVYDMQ